MGSSRKAKARHKTVHTKVQVGLRRKRKPPAGVVLPGTTQTSAWTEGDTLGRNYRALGLANDPNAGFGRVNPVVRPPAEEADGPKLADEAVTDEDSMRVCLGQPLAKGHRAPRRLTAKQLSVVGALVAAHGDDIAAMARDLKRNAMQHTAGQLRVLVDAFHMQGEALQSFRAPQKRL